MNVDNEPIKVGFWKSDGFAKERSTTGVRGMDFLAETLLLLIEAPLPSVFDHIDSTSTWDSKERDQVARYIADARFRRETYMGDSVCRMCGKANGSADFSDGKYIWPEGLAHYVTAHRVRLPSKFVQHVLRKVSR